MAYVVVVLEMPPAPPSDHGPYLGSGLLLAFFPEITDEVMDGLVSAVEAGFMEWIVIPYSPGLWRFQPGPTWNFRRVLGD